MPGLNSPLINGLRRWHRKRSFTATPGAAIELSARVSLEVRHATADATSPSRIAPRVRQRLGRHGRAARRRLPRPMDRSSRRPCASAKAAQPRHRYARGSCPVSSSGAVRVRHRSRGNALIRYQRIRHPH